MPKILLSIAEGLLSEVDSIVRDRHKNRSEFVREALRKSCVEYYQSRIQKKEAEQIDQVSDSMTELPPIGVEDADR